MAVTPESLNSAPGRAILRAWRLSNGWTQSTSPRKNRRRKRRRNAKSRKRNRSRQRLKLRSARGKSRGPKLPLRDKRNPPRRRPKNRNRKSGVGSDENQTIAKLSRRGVREVLVGATVVLREGLSRRGRRRQSVSSSRDEASRY